MEICKKILVAAVILILLMSTMPIIKADIPPIQDSTLEDNVSFLKCEGYYAITLSANTQSESTNDPTPRYRDTSLYMLGNCTVEVLFLESNGTIDPETENWEISERNKSKEEIDFATGWWSSQNPGAITFHVIYSLVKTGYEPITRPITDMVLWISEVLTTKGYPLPPGGAWFHQIYDYVNALRDLYNTNWAFIVFLVDSSNDSDGYFEGGGGPECTPGGPSIRMTRDNGKEHVGFENMDKVMAHEMGNVFWAKDESSDNIRYGGYLNSSNVPHSGCIMDPPEVNWCISSGTRNQVGWTDTDSDTIPNILDTFPTVSIDYMDISARKLNITGTAAVNPHENLGKIGSGRDITINTIEAVEYRIDGGEWIEATVIPTKLWKQVRYKQYAWKDTYAIVNYTFVTSELQPGEHFIEVKATNQWDNSGFANQTVTIPEPTHNVSIKTIAPYRTVIGNNTSTTINITAANIGDYPETFNITLCYNTTQIETQELTLTTGQSTLTFEWTTPLMPGNYTLTAVASQVTGETEIEDNTLTYYPIQISIAGDVNADGTVNIVDISKAAVAFQTNPGDPNWNSNADVNEDTVINIVDISKIAIEYGKTT